MQAGRAASRAMKSTPLPNDSPKVFGSLFGIPSGIL